MLLGVYVPGGAYPGRAPDYSGLATLDLGVTTVTSLAPVRTTIPQVPVRMTARLSPLRTVQALES